MTVILALVCVFVAVQDKWDVAQYLDVSVVNVILIGYENETTCVVLKERNKVAWLYLSYVDANRPKGEQFIGCAYVQSDPDLPGVGLSWCVDGVPEDVATQIAIILIPSELEHKIPANHKYHNRLLSKEELRAACAEVGDGIVNAKGEIQ